jgi:L-ribulokinase
VTHSPEDCFTVGVDFGTLSGRALVVRVSDGLELGSAEYAYPHTVMETALPGGATLPPEWALQHPSDYLEVFKHAVPQALRSSGVDPSSVIGIGVDFTACTVLPTLADGTPLCQLERFQNRPHAFVKLWKHHAAQPQADRVSALAHERHELWIGRYGGKISSEWTFPKALQMLEEDAEVFSATERFIEAADWVVWQLCGVETRNACTAGYKEIYQDGAYPSREYLAALHPEFPAILEKLGHDLSPLGSRAGGLTPEAAAWTGLPVGIAVAVGNVDAHVTAPAADAVGAGQMVAIMGTSTCHVMNGTGFAAVPGMCGVVDGGITPGLWGFEAGQSGVGDLFGWLVKHATPPEYIARAEERGIGVHELLTEDAARQGIGEHGLVALDWLNGNRSVLVNAELSGVFVGVTLATRAPDLYRALLESTAFGTRVILEAFEASGVPVDELVIAGGLMKNGLLMQIYADVTGRELSLTASAQGGALGSAIFAAVAAGAHADIYAAAKAMGKRQRGAYKPIPENQRLYDRLYAEYRTLHEYFGRGANDAMKRLKALRAEAIASRGGTPSQTHVTGSSRLEVVA